MNRTIGIDYGRARVGLAVSDPLGFKTCNFTNFAVLVFCKVFDDIRQGC